MDEVELYISLCEDLSEVDDRVLVLVERLISMNKRRDNQIQQIWDLTEQLTGPLGTVEDL